MKGRIFLVLVIFIVFNRTGVSAAKWETFTDLKNVVSISVSSSQNLAYCATSGGLFVVDLSNGRVLEKYNNVNGLVSNNLTTTIIDKFNRLWLGASDGSIVIFDYLNKKWNYIYDIKNSNEANKSINYFITYQDYIFAATGFGIQKISVNNFSFVDAPYYQLGSFNSKTSVNTLVIYTDKIFAGTSVGIAYARLRSSNLNNPGSWLNYNQSPLNGNVRCFEEFNGYLFAGSDSGFVYYDTLNWNLYPNYSLAHTPIRSLKSVSNYLYIATPNSLLFAHQDSLTSPVTFMYGDSYNTINSDINKNIIIGVYEKGLRAKINNSYTDIYPDCPNRNSFDDIVEDDFGNMWFAGGALDAGFYRFDGKIWTFFTIDKYPAIGNSNFFRRIIAGRGQVWALGYGGGPTRIVNDNIKNFNPQNSNLPGIPANPNYCVPFGGAFDNNGVLWLSFYVSNSGGSIYAYSGNDSVWIRIPNPPVISASNLEQVAVDSYNTKWVVSGETTPRGVYFYNENGTLGNLNDDISGFYSLSDFGPEVTDIKDLLVDKNNEIWIATSNGVFIINDPLSAIRNPNQKPAPVKLGIISGNLRVPFTENCNCIAIDILNQKWIGTDINGVFHLSEDGSTLIEQFNTNNSPILSNRITSIYVSQKTGKAYFGTNNGLSAFQTYAIQPVENFDKIVCAPNPYIVPSSVELHIDGLVENSSIKIMTLNGEVIAEFDSPGGKVAYWNGIGKNGKYAASGIYIVVAYNSNGSKVGTGKLVILKK
ncbi:MAG: hypothetical protein ACP5P3_01970 [Ignavibacteria bacterium]